MQTGTNAREWFLSKYGTSKSKVYTSKYYTPEDSWPKTHVWWLQIPLTAIDRSKYDFVNLVCQAGPNENNYHYLKVPTSYLNEHLEKFDRIGEILSLYLSANSKTLFVEERGTGSLNFFQFLVSPSGASVPLLAPLAQVFILYVPIWPPLAQVFLH